MHLQTHTPGASMFSILRKDPIVRLAGLVLLLTAVPYFLPGLGPDTRAAWGSLYSAFPLLAICLLAFQFRLRRIADPDERRFWNLWTTALSAWLLNSLLALWFDRQRVDHAEPTDLSTAATFFSTASRHRARNPPAAGHEPAGAAGSGRRKSRYPGLLLRSTDLLRHHSGVLGSRQLRELVSAPVRGAGLLPDRATRRAEDERIPTVSGVGFTDGCW